MEQKLNHIERLNKLLYSEMTVVSRVKDKKTPEQKGKEITNMFKGIFNKTPGLSERPYWIGDDDDFRPIGNTMLMGVGTTLTFKKDDKNTYDYYNVNKTVEKQITDFKNKVKKIAKVNWKKHNVRNNTSYSLQTTASFALLGHVVLKQIVSYLYDKNTGKKYKLGTYHNKYEAEGDIGGLTGVSRQSSRSSGHEIYYWGRNGAKAKTLKKFDTEDEMNKYYKNLEVSVEEVER